MNKGDIVEKLRERGLSRRNAVRILNLILDEVSAALGRGEAVEFAFGSLKRVRHAHKQQQGRFLNRKTTIYRKPFTVLLEVDAAGEELLKKRKKETVSPRAPAMRPGYLGLPVRLPPRPNRP
jgi:nucleoid DNA-binding protein